MKINIYILFFLRNGNEEKLNRVAETKPGPHIWELARILYSV